MSELASVHLRQARGFVQGRDWPRALVLLEKARVLSRNNRDLTIQVLKELVQTYDGLGRFDMAAQCRDRLNRLAPQAQHAVPLPYDSRRAARGAQSFSPRKAVFLVAGILVILLGLSAVVYFTMSSKPAAQVVQTVQPASSTSTTPAVAQTVGLAAPVRPAPAVEPPSPVAVASAIPAPSSVPPLPAPAPGQVRESLLKDTVGMCLVIARFEGFVAGKKGRIDVPVGFGTAFVIHKSGLLLTNRHVVETAEQMKVPRDLKFAGLPGMVFHEVTYTVCFGPHPADRFVAKVMHRSENFDMALLKIDRKCAHVLPFSHSRQPQGTEVYLCGYPGAVVMCLNGDVMTPEKIAERRQKWTSTYQVDAFDDFSEESFNSTLTRGIVSASERKIHNSSYVQIDAASSPGNSGGPVLDANNNVIGMLTMGPANAGGDNYSFALTLEQFDADLSPYLRD